MVRLLKTAPSGELMAMSMLDMMDEIDKKAKENDNICFKHNEKSKPLCKNGDKS